MILPDKVSFYAISPAELDRAVREAIKHEKCATAETLAGMWDCSPDFIKKIAKENKIVPLGVPGHGKVRVYPINQIKELFKPII